MDMRNRLKSAVRDGKTKEVQDILNSSPQLEVSVYYKHDLLRSAIDLQYIDIANLLLSNGFELIYENERPECSLLYRAIVNNDAGMVNVLLKKGIDPSVTEESQNFSPLFVAIDQGSLEIATLLIERGIDVNDCDPNNGITPLGFAVRRGNVEIAELFLKHGANVNRAQFDENQSTLSYATANADLGMVNLLLSCNVTVDDEIKAFYKKQSKMWTSSFYYVYRCLLTPFESALERRHRDIAKVLLISENNKNDGPQKNEKIKTPFESYVLKYFYGR